MNRREYDALPKGTKVQVNNPDGRVQFGIICKRYEYGRSFVTKPYSVVSIDGHTPSDYVPMFISLVK
jgi:hypothetical protein